jgi:hypothetical protein
VLRERTARHSRSLPLPAPAARGVRRLRFGAHHLLSPAGHRHRRARGAAADESTERENHGESHALYDVATSRRARRGRWICSRLSSSRARSGLDVARLWQ